MLVPLVVFGSTPVQAFPNVGVSLQEAIQKHVQEDANKNPMNGFRFGILGSFEFKTVSHRFRSDWQGVLARIKGETAVYRRCGAGAADCPPKVREWRKLLKSLKGQPADIQLTKLNKSINRMADYADDDKVFGKRDYWATPLEFLKGKADCEDYAVVKFWSLLELGFRNDQLRLAVVRDRRRKIVHAVVTVDTDDRTIVLDSLFDHPVEQRHILKYAPIYSANLDDQWAHIVTRKIRVSYINYLEDRAKGRVVPVKAKPSLRPAVKAKSRPIGLASGKRSGFVDWT